MKERAALHRLLGVFEGLDMVLEHHRPSKEKLEAWSENQQDFIKDVLERES